MYFGDAGSPAVLHSIGAHKASCAVVTLDSPGANYRTVWALNKHFPGLKVYVRAHDVDHGRNLEKVGGRSARGAALAVRQLVLAVLHLGIEPLLRCWLALGCQLSCRLVSRLAAQLVEMLR